MMCVSLAVLRNEGRFLCYLRDNKPEIAHPGCWSFMGGKVEDGESPLEAINRELKEEIEVKNLEPLVNDSLTFVDMLPVRGNPEVYDHDIYFFKGTTSRTIPQLILHEGQRLEFYTPDEIQKLKFPNFLKQYFKANIHLFNR